MSLPQDTIRLKAISGRVILITRPMPEAETTAQLVEKYSGKAILAPVMEMAPPDDPQPFLDAMNHLESYQGIVLTSVHGVRAFIQALDGRPLTATLWAVGKKTAQQLQSHGLQPCIPKNPTGGQNLGQEILQAMPPKQRFLFPRAQEGHDELCHMLQNADHRVDLVAGYQMRAVDRLPQETLDLLEQREVDAIPFFSGRSAQAFVNALPDDWQEWLKKPRLAALSTVTAHAMRAVGLRVDVVANQTSAEAMLLALAHHWHGT